MKQYNNSSNSLVKLMLILLALPFAQISEAQQMSLRDAFQDKFLIGTAVNMWQVRQGGEKMHSLIKNQYSAVVAENCMKAETVQPIENIFNFKDGDDFVAFAEKNNQTVTGHCLVWHSQAPTWFFTNDKGVLVDRETMIARMRKHIYTVVGHYKGKVKGWDVVNEAIEGDGSLRHSNFYNIIGEDYIRLAFQFAHEADPDAELYYNDYSMDNPAKRDAVIKLIRDLKAHGLRIDAIGMQSHLGLDTDLKQYEQSLVAYANEGVKVMATELEVSVLPWPSDQQTAEISTNFAYQEKLNPFKNGISAEMQAQQDKFMVKLFNIYKKHAKDISRITFWGVTDGDSWKNDFPIKGRTDYPLPFGRDLQAKPWVEKIMN